MSTLWAPGALFKTLAKVEVRGQEGLRAAMAGAASAIEAQAKINASHGSHTRDTPTPATRGSGPAIITGTLRRSIVHTPVVPIGVGWEAKVGMASGVYPMITLKTKPSHLGKTPSSKYGLYLETVWDYPFLLPALTSVAQRIAWVPFFAGRW